MDTLYDKALLQRVKRLRFGKRSASTDLMGAYRSRQKGHGLEYVESRGYEPGDDVRRMDWKVMARTSEPYVKLFQEERQLKILSVVDVSNSMRFGGAARTKLQTALSCAMAISYSAIRERDQAQLVLFGDGIERVFPIVHNEKEFWAISRQVEQLPLSPYEQQVATLNPVQVCDFVIQQRQKPQIVFWFSDFQPAQIFSELPSRWPRRATLVPVRVNRGTGSKKITLRGINSETGHAALFTAQASAEKILGQTPVQIDDHQDLWLGLRKILLQSRRGR